MNHNKVDSYQLFKYFFLCFFIIISNCTGVNTSNTVPNDNISKNIEQKETSNKSLNFSNKFTVKSSSTIAHELPLPFSISTVNCSNCLGEAKVDMSVSNGEQISYNGHSSLTIASDGNIYFSVFTLGGWLYGGTHTSIFAKTEPKSSLIGSISSPILTDAHACRAGTGSTYGYDSSSIVSPTRFFRSGNITISISGRDLIVNVSGITSDFEAYWMAPWDGSCRISQRYDNITSGTVSATFKNVLGFEDTLDVTSSSGSIGSDSDSLPLQSTLTVNPSNTTRPWTLKVSGPLNDNTCTPYSKQYNNSGTVNNITFPDGLPVNQLTNGDYTVEAFFDDDPQNKKSLNIHVQNKVDLDVSIPEGKGLDSQKIFSAVSGGQADFKVTAPNCPNWQLKIAGKKPDIFNPDGSTTAGPSCNWTSNGSGNQDVVTWKGTCDDGSVMADGSYTATLSVADQIKSKTIKLDNTSPRVENMEFKNTDSSVSVEVTINDPNINGVSSGLDEDSINAIISNTNLPFNILKLGNKLKIIINSNGDNNKGKLSNILSNISNGNFKIIAKDKLKNQYSNVLKNFTVSFNFNKGFTISSSQSNNIKDIRVPVGTCGQKKQKINFTLGGACISDPHLEYVNLKINILDSNGHSVFGKLISLSAIEIKKQIELKGSYNGSFDWVINSTSLPKDGIYYPTGAKESSALLYYPEDYEIQKCPASDLELPTIEIYRPYSDENPLYGTDQSPSTQTILYNKHINTRSQMDKTKFLYPYNNLDSILDEIASITKYPNNALEGIAERDDDTGEVIKCEGLFTKNYKDNIGYNYNGKQYYKSIRIIFNKDGQFVTAFPD